MPSVCLSMIVKNEAHCISRCLNSVKPYIDYWVISDTGSTDNTEQVIKECLKDIPGELHHHEWVDFSTNRNNVLQLCKDKATYTLVIDADDYLVVDQPDIFTKLINDAYKITIKHNTISYNRVQLFRNSIPAKYVGVLHEYLDLPLSVQAAATILPGCHMIFGASGARSQNPLKFLHDAQVLEKAILQEPKNERYAFYCAQSYRDAGELRKALNYYTKRSSMGGWSEEVYYSILESGKLLERLNPDNKEVIESAYLRAHNYLPTRAEAICYLASYYRRNNNFDKAYFYAKVGIAIKQPMEGLFIEPSCYVWRLKDELAISAYYIGKISEAKRLNMELLRQKDVPDDHRDRITKNLQFCNSY